MRNRPGTGWLRILLSSCLLLPLFFNCTEDRNNPLDPSGQDYKNPIGIVQEAYSKSLYINDTVALQVRCSTGEKILKEYRWGGDIQPCSTKTGLYSGSWQTEGKKRILVYAVDDFGRNSDTIMYEIDVKLGRPILSDLRDTSCFINDSIQITAFAEDENGIIDHFQWSVDGEQYDEGESTITMYWPDDGEKTVQVFVVDDDGIASETKSFKMTINLGRPRVLIADTSVVIRDSLYFTPNHYDNGEIKRYIREHMIAGTHNIDTIPANPFKMAWSVTGIQEVIIRGVDDDGLVSHPDTCSITVLPGPKPTVSIISLIDTCYIRDTILISARGNDLDGSISRYFWSHDGQENQQTDSLLLIAFEEPGMKEIFVRAADNDGQLSQPDSCEIYVDLGAPTITPIQDTVVSVTCSCAVDIEFEANDNSPLSELVWYWDTGAPGWDDSTTGPTVSFGQYDRGDLTVIWAVRDKDSIFSSPDTFTITFNRPPTVSLIEPVDADTVAWQTYSPSEGKGSAQFRWQITDLDGREDIDSTILLLGQNPNDFSLRYAVFDSAHTVTGLDTSTHYWWQVVTFDLFGDSSVATGQFYTLYGPPSVATHPNDTDIERGDSVILRVSANGHDIRYQWLRDTESIAGATDSWLIIDFAEYDHSGVYQCIVTNRAGADTSGEARLRVSPAQPAIVTEPNDTAVVQHTSAFFTIAVEGDSLTYQWQKNGSNIPANGNEPQYEQTNAQLSDNGALYRCIISNTSGADTSRTCTLTVQMAPPVITAHPDPAVVAVGQKARFGVRVTGDSVYYQWQKDDVTFDSGETLDSIFIDPCMLADSGVYRCVVSNGVGADTSSLVNLNVNRVYFDGDTVYLTDILDEDSDGYFSVFNISWNPDIESDSCSTYVDISVGYNTDTADAYTPFFNPTNTMPIYGKERDLFSATNDFAGHDSGAYNYRCILLSEETPVDTVIIYGHHEENAAQDALPPTITAHPQDAEVDEGYIAIFRVAADGTGPIHYQWQRNGTDVGGNDSIYLYTAALSNDNDSILCIVSNAAGSITSDYAILSVTMLPPVITAHPSDETVEEGERATFIVSATGSDLHYQWQRNGTNISGATSSRYTTPVADNSDDGDRYRCIVSNEGGSVTSNYADLEVTVSTITINVTNELVRPISIFVNDVKIATVAQYSSESLSIQKPNSLKITYRSDPPSYGGNLFGWVLAETVVNTSNIRSSYSINVDNVVDGQQYYYTILYNNSDYILSVYQNELLLDSQIGTTNWQAQSISHLGYCPLYPNTIVNCYWKDIYGNFHWYRYCDAYSNAEDGSGLVEINVDNRFPNNICY